MFGTGNPLLDNGQHSSQVSCYQCCRIEP
jgi:hypothetical protein